MRKYVLMTTVSMLLAAPAFAGNYINIINPTGNDGVVSLAITQDYANDSNVISADGTTNTAFPIMGIWNTINIQQYGASNILKGTISASGSGAILNATYGTGSQDSGTFTGSNNGGGFNVHSLTIGGSGGGPLDPQVTITVDNTNGTPAIGNANTITDNFQVNSNASGLTYNLTLYGDTNTVQNTMTSVGTSTVNETIGAIGNGSTQNNVTNLINAGGALTYTLAITGGNSNIVDNTINTSGATNVTQNLTGGSNHLTDNVGVNAAVNSYMETTNATGSNNIITNMVAGAGGNDIVGISLDSDSNTVSNTVYGTGTQTSDVTETGVSRIDFTLKSGTMGTPVAGSSSNVTLNNVIGGGGAQAAVNVTQTGNGDTLVAMVTGINSGTVGAGGLNFTQASAGASATIMTNGSGSGYTINVKQ